MPISRVRYLPIPHPSATLLGAFDGPVLVRLACLNHAANVRSEPGSNPSIDLRLIYRFIQMHHERMFTFCVLGHQLLITTTARNLIRLFRVSRLESVLIRSVAGPTLN